MQFATSAIFITTQYVKLGYVEDYILKVSIGARFCIQSFNMQLLGEHQHTPKRMDFTMEFYKMEVWI
jgi:hypothetical protein